MRSEYNPCRSQGGSLPVPLDRGLALRSGYFGTATASGRNELQSVNQ